MADYHSGLYRVRLSQRLAADDTRAQYRRGVPYWLHDHAMANRYRQLASDDVWVFSADTPHHQRRHADLSLVFGTGGMGRYITRRWLVWPVDTPITLPPLVSLGSGSRFFPPPT